MVILNSVRDRALRLVQLAYSSVDKAIQGEKNISFLNLSHLLGCLWTKLKEIKCSISYFVTFVGMPVDKAIQGENIHHFLFCYIC